MAIDMTDPKAGRAEKRAFNIENKRYGVGRKAARTNRDWAGWDAPRKKAYNQRRKYHRDTIAMDRQQKRAYNASKRAKWSDAMKTAWKESWKTKTATWNKKRGQAGTPAPVFANKKKRAMDKMKKFMGVEPEPEIEEAPMEQHRPKRKRRNELESLQENLVHV